MSKIHAATRLRAAYKLDLESVSQRLPGFSILSVKENELRAKYQGLACTLKADGNLIVKFDKVVSDMLYKLAAQKETDDIPYHQTTNLNIAINSISSVEKALKTKREALLIISKAISD